MIAVALSPKARALIRANREPLAPTAEDRERVTAALRARLGATVLPLDTPARIPLLSAGMQWRLAAAFGVCVAGSVVFLAGQSGPVEPAKHISAPPVVAAPAATQLSPPSPASAQPETILTPERTVAPPAPRHAHSKAAPTPPTPDTLAQELALLTSAASQLSSGQASGALLALEEHQRRFSHGALSDERNVAKARALCMLHRFDEGRAVVARIASGTPAAARVKEECDSAWARANTARLTHEGE